jgi:hypothetical protein
MLIWKRLMPPKVRALLALGTLTALVAVATLKPLPNVWGQDKKAPTRKVGRQAEEKAEVQTEKAPEKTEGKAPKKEEGRVPRKTEGKAPLKEEGNAPRKVEGKGPMQEEGRGPKGRLVPRKGDPENPKDPVPGRGRPVPVKEEPKGGGEQLAKEAFEYDARASTTCGRGKICFNFKLPKMKDSKGKIITATGKIGLTLHQDGQPITTIESPLLNEKMGGQYCFPIDPTKFQGLDSSLGGLDFMAKVTLEWDDGNWTDGITPSSTATVGARSEGIHRGLNNDYQFVCKEVPKVMPKEVEKVVIEGLPEDFDEQQRRVYDRLEHKDLSFEEYLRYVKLEFGRRRQLEKKPALRYQPGRRGKSASHTVCGNGDFEQPLDPANPNGPVNPAEWDGGYGTVDLTGQLSPFTTGLFPGAITDFNAHQTIVSAGTLDPNVPIEMTGPNTNISMPSPSPNAVRIGNAVNGSGAELISKTFSVTPSDTLIRFWYAVVMENPGTIQRVLSPPFKCASSMTTPASKCRIW